ncbi:MAG: hypothetical protein DMD59_11615 [Gemmatimonadetes bacterium]|nr:MAG: hypothetical protein DMD59_11615 [Gemmatimonadota bacterium]
MTNRQQWTLIAGVVTTAVFGVALAIKLRPQLNLLEIGSTAPAFYPDKEQNGPAQILAFANDLGLTFDILHDPSGAIRQSYDIFGVPESYLIDRDGMIVKRVIGAANWEDPVNEVLIRRLLSEP